MASWMVHLRVADALLRYMTNIDTTAFVVGNMAPDSGVPNDDWSEFRPPAAATHFKTRTDTGSIIDTDAFCDRYFNSDVMTGYGQREYSFFLGYYVHLLTDVRWVQTILASLREEHPEEYAEDRRGLIRTAKEDWYDLDFLYLERNPGFGAFSAYENAAGFENTFMEMFDRDAFDNRRRYICGFYRGDEHGEIHREYRYLSPERADAFVGDTAEWLRERMRAFLAYPPE